MIKIRWLILAIAAGSFLSGVVLEGIAMGNDSNLVHLLTNGAGYYDEISLSKYSEIPGFSVPLIRYAQLAENIESTITHASISFGIGSTLVDPDGIPGTRDEYLDSGITQCNFHSFDNVSLDSCISCILVSIEETGEHIPVAQGQIVLDEEYQASDKLVIPITELAFDGANDSENVNGVAIEFCDTGLGCTAEFWQQEQSIAFWPSSISPDDTFESVFQRSIFEKGPGNGQGNPKPLNQNGNGTVGNIPDNTLGLGKPQPTLLDVLSYSGNAKNDFAANAVAALLNAETIENSFGYDPEEIILMSQQAIDEGEYEAARDLLAAKNELGCPFLETIGETKGE